MLFYFFFSSPSVSLHSCVFSPSPQVPEARPHIQNPPGRRRIPSCTGKGKREIRRHTLGVKRVWLTNCICFGSSWQAEALLLALSSPTHKHTYTPQQQPLCALCPTAVNPYHTVLHTRTHPTAWCFRVSCGHITDICVSAAAVSFWGS